MKSFYESYTFILSFVILEVAINLLFGDKFTEWFLYLMLFSMVLINSEKFVAFVDEKFLK